MIFGAAGALGRAISKHFSKDLIYDVIRCGRSLSPLIDVDIDVNDMNIVCSNIEKYQPDIIINAAATYFPGVNAVNVNLNFSLNLLDYFELKKDLHTKLVFIGSAAEYGVPENQNSPVKETDMLQPISRYGLYKMLQTQAIEYYSSKGMQIFNARLFNLFGEGVSDQLLPGMLAKKVDQYKQGLVSKIFMNDLSQFRDFISTEQAAIYIDNILKYGNFGETYNVGSGQPILVRDFVHSYLSSKGIPLTDIEESKLVVGNSGLYKIFADMSKTNRIDS